ncbi:MAG: hypothetical protein ACI9T9_001151, partial [Oleiphilaceae bacterium]
MDMQGIFIKNKKKGSLPLLSLKSKGRRSPPFLEQNNQTITLHQIRFLEQNNQTITLHQIRFLEQNNQT